MKVKRWISSLLAPLLMLGLMAPVIPNALAATVIEADGGSDGQGSVDLQGEVIGPPKVTVTFHIIGVDGRPLGGVVVNVADVGSVTTENQSGEAVFDNLIDTRTYSYTATKGGYTGVNSSFTASAGYVVPLTMSIPSGGGDSGDGGGGGGGGSGDGGTTLPDQPGNDPPVVTPPETDPPVITPPETDPPVVTPDTPTPEPAPTPEAPSAKPEQPPSRPTARPDELPPEPSNDKNTPEPVPPIVLKPESGEDTGRVQIPSDAIAQSAKQEAPVEVVLKQDGEERPVVVEPFTSHDQQLVSVSEVWIEDDPADEQAPILHIVVPGGGEIKDVSAGIPHNLMETARRQGTAIRVSIEDVDEHGPTGEYVLDVQFPKGYFDSDQYDRQDTSLEHDGEAGWLVFSNRYEEHKADATVTVLPADYGKAREENLGIKIRIYNPNDAEELWYEWVFRPEDLEKAKTMETDLYIVSQPPESDPVHAQLSSLGGRYQLLSIAYEGALPARAELRVKNLAGFGPHDAVTLYYSNPETDKLESVYTDLHVGEDGFISYEMEHCSTYVLAAPANYFWLWITLAVAAAAALCLLLIFFTRRVRDRAALLILQALLSGDMTINDLTAGVNALETKNRTWTEMYLAGRVQKLTARELVSVHHVTSRYHITESGRAYLDAGKKKEN